MLPVYDPKSFADIDLRKYHIKDMKDALRFVEFVTARLEELQFVIKKFNNNYALFQTVSAQLRQKQEAELHNYGIPDPNLQQNDASAEVQIQSVDRSVEQEHDMLLSEIRKASAEENLAVEVEERAESMTGDDPVQAILGNYKVVLGKKGPMFYRTNAEGKTKLVKKDDVPEDIKQALINQAENQLENK